MENSALLKIKELIENENLIKLILSNKRNKAYHYKKVVIRKLSADASESFFCESFTEKQAFHKNIEKTQLFEFITSQLNENFKQLDGILTNKTFTLKLSSKNKVLYTEKAISNSSPCANTLTQHNRDKNYIFNKNEFIPALYELGVITEDGKIINAQYDKYKQINRFVEIIDDCLKNENKNVINIIDFGCGKSYLTFVLYHYLTKVKNTNANIVGLDLKKDVIEKCNNVAKKYGYENLTFFCGDIKDYKSDFVPDMVITLHACDTATDFALYNSIVWGAKYIFSVPCCQHEVNKSIKTETLKSLTDYGIVKERISALITDTVRCKLLEYCGYKVDLMEFIDIAHSPKNLLIRARKCNVSAAKKENSLSEIKDLQKQFKFEQTLMNLILKN